MNTFSPGTLVRCREREWVVLPSPETTVLRLRPLGGSEHEVISVARGLAALGIDAVEETTLPAPDPAAAGDLVAGQLLRDATRLTLRSGAGPFRSLGRISVRPRPFQIVPLLMALRLDPVRMLIADDVGIGKTIEAGLIARELLDRGDVQRLCVLCPPHLCDQWQRELREKFAIEAVVVRAATLGRLERDLVGDVSVFAQYPALVVSIDFVKSDRRRASFLTHCPDLVIVDEAHTAARANDGGTTQQRHDLLRDLAADPARHLLLLTATPHSGIEDSFRSLLELLDPRFSRLDLDQLSEPDRRWLARHFVQRRRADLGAWLGDGERAPFPERRQVEIMYQLARSPAYHDLFTDIYAFARELVRDDSGAAYRQRVRYWTALALLRCVMSSPAAAEAALSARLGRLTASTGEDGDDQLFASYVLDISDTESPQDLNPTQVIAAGDAQLSGGERRRLQAFIARATKLRGDDDPKLRAAASTLTELLRAGHNPIVYCRYIATAKYLAEDLARRLRGIVPDLHVMAVTGDSSEEEREQRVTELSAAPRRLLVATDCLSEGINLQDAFDAVLHYDLPWNPNRLEQREGRVDRYGQRAPEVAAVLLVGQDNPIDQAVLDVLLRKARVIHRTLGISVPLPVDSETVVDKVVRSLFQQPQSTQLTLFADDPAVGVAELHAAWNRAAEREHTRRTRFAQHAIKPEEVAQELYASDDVLGSPATIAAFVSNACQRLGAALQPVAPRRGRGGPPDAASFILTRSQLPTALRERLAQPPRRAGGRAPDELLIGFDTPLPDGATLVGRLHPLAETLAEYVLASAFDPQPETLVAARCGAVRSAAVARRTTLLLLRVRLLIESPDRAPLLAEEVIICGFSGRPDAHSWLGTDAARALLDAPQPVGDLDPAARAAALVQAVSWLPELQGELDAIATARSVALLDSHRRVRQVTRAARVTVKPQFPLDLLGLYLLLPVPQGVA